MDAKILRSLLSSCESVTKDLEKSEDYQKLLKEEEFLPSNVIFKGLSSSLTNLLSYKVSKEAYQRYAVRLHVIGILRDWSRINDTLKDFHIFRDQKYTSTFVQSLLQKYLTRDVLDSCDSVEYLVPVTSAIMCLSATNSSYKAHLDKLLSKLSVLESSEQSERLLCRAVQENSNLNLELSTIDSIYSSQKHKLIEQPLLNDFVSSSVDLNKEENVDDSGNTSLLDQLFKYTIRSQQIFLLICGFLKELLIQLDHAPTVLSFIQSTVHRIKERCKSEDRDILDLYPRNLQSTIILLRIEPLYHTADSKSSTLKILENIYSEDKDSVIILLSHFPQWLKLFGELLSDSDGAS